MDSGLLEHFRRLGVIRSAYKVFKEGPYRELFHDDNCIVFERRTADEVVAVVVNMGSNKYTLRFDGALYDLMGGGSFISKINIASHQCSVFGNKPIF